MEFAKILKALRKSMSLTQKELAHKLEVQRTTIAGYETGRSEPDFTKLKKLSEIFNVSIDYLLGNTDYALSRSQQIPLLDLRHGLQQTMEYITVEMGEEADHLFALKVLEHHLFPEISQGDILIVREINKEDPIENGDLVLGLVTDDRFILGSFLEVKDQYILLSKNTSEQGIKANIYSTRDIRIIGKVIERRTLF
ncbi:MAG: helix-turn-helix domain-containing protein [Tissierellia bacterium]|nr:helix-turn-helix domain-containing protein [Tissierellia bacterium]